MKANAPTLDVSAIVLSGLCLIHCLALPLMSAFAPLIGVLADAEWIHKAFVLCALPITVMAITRHPKTQPSAAFVAPAIVGLSLLLAGAFVEPLHDVETPLTVLGATLLAAAHIWRWRRQNTPA